MSRENLEIELGDDMWCMVRGSICAIDYIGSDISSVVVYTDSGEKVRLPYCETLFNRVSEDA